MGPFVAMVTFRPKCRVDECNEDATVRVRYESDNSVFYSDYCEKHARNVLHIPVESCPSEPEQVSTPSETQASP
jgi:hypothetical protein